MKLHIIGPSGSGKTFLAKELSKKYNIPSYELDPLFWDHLIGKDNVKRDAKERDVLRRNILSTDNWIIEGVQHTWGDESFMPADKIYLLEPSPLFCRIRIVRRFFQRKSDQGS